jgi:integrase
LTVLGRSVDHLRHVNTRLRRLVRECRWTRLADVTPASFQSWRKEQVTKAPKTLNEYLATLSAFWTWLRKQSRVTVNPFELVERTDTRGKERVQRRALSDAQAIQLLQVAGKNQLAYMLPLYAGLRRNEAKTLHWSDLVLGDNGGLLRLHAAVNKNRKEQSLPLHRDLAKALQQQKPANCKANDLVLVNGVPKMKEFRQDLKKAGIPFLDERGHRMDYHALRTTFITRLSTMKVHPRLAMELARHSDMRLTMKTYTDAGQLPLREVMDTLPSFGGDSRIDSRNLGPTGQTVSRPVTETRELKTENIIANKGGSHDLTLAVAVCHSEQQSGIEGVRIPLSPPYFTGEF